jgi:hypothetical protein
MLERTKKRHTEIELHFKGPAGKRSQAIKALQSLGFTATEEVPPWREVLMEADDPGVCLAGARHREGLTQRQLSETTDIPQRHISEMENGKRPIGKKNAKIFAKALHIDFRVLL